MRHRHHIVKTAFVLLAALVGGLFNELCEAASTNTVDQTLTDTNLAAKVATDYEKYKKGQIDKGTMAKSLWNAWNQTSQDMYGKVTDQNGQPVAGVDVTGIARQINGYNEKFTSYKTHTDTNGLFQFTGLHGYRLDAQVGKAGYEMDYRRGIFKPSDQSSPTNRVIYTMWKLRGPDPMKHVKFIKDASCEGSMSRFELLSSTQNGTGDLMVTLTRNPLNLRPEEQGKPFNWTATFGITNGGLIEIPSSTIYPYEAPTEGYQHIIAWNYPTNVTGWDWHIQRSYYFKSQNGQVYGRIKIEIWAGGKTPDMGLGMDIYANPGGSRNLEFDSSKQIMR